MISLHLVPRGVECPVRFVGPVVLDFREHELSRLEVDLLVTLLGKYKHHFEIDLVFRPRNAWSVGMVPSMSDIPYLRRFGFLASRVFFYMNGSPEALEIEHGFLAPEGPSSDRRVRIETGISAIDKVMGGGISIGRVIGGCNGKS
jgi:hypothetical protein